jgi:uncharacterized heparinase superfamily protein
MLAPRGPRNLRLERIFNPEELRSDFDVDFVEACLQRKFTVLGRSIEFDRQIDWQADFKGGSWPVLFAWDYNRLFRNDFSDPDYTRHGDIKRAWDFNKHLHFIDLAVCFNRTKDERCRKEIEFELRDWIRKNPYLRGVGWSAQLIVAQRAISWLLAYNLGAVLNNLEGDLAHSLYLHGVYLSKNLEESSSGVNSNHLIGDLAGLNLIGRSLGQDKWVEESQRKLMREIDAQIYEDGVHYEQSSGYHRYVEEFFYLVWLANGRSPEQLTRKLTKMSRFLNSIKWPNGRQPFLSDWDGAKVWVKDLHTPSELYLLAPSLEVSKSFPDGGYSVIQYANHKLIFDCGPIGMGNKQLATHGHSDLLSFTLALYGDAILVDPGSGSYTEDKEVHDYCRSSRGHNTLILDGRDQCGLSRTWTLLNHPSAKLLEWRTSESVDVVEGEHDGYSPIIHRRRIEFKKEKEPTVIVSDFLRGSGTHRIEIRYHFSPEVKARIDGQSFLLEAPSSTIAISAHTALDARLEDGYYAYDYGVITKTTVGCFYGEVSLPALLKVHIQGRSSLS